MIDEHHKKGKFKMYNKWTKLTYWILFTFYLLTMEAYGQNYYGKKVKEKYEIAISRNIAYGKEKGMVGIISEEDHPRIGPESFSNDIEGNIYICDRVNERIQVFSPNGLNLFTISLGNGSTVSDIAVDRYGLIYVYDIQGKLYQYDKKGKLLGTINVDNNRWQVRMPMHIINGKIYIRTVEQEDVLIAKVVKGILIAPTVNEISQPLEKGIHGLSGNRYLVRLSRWEKGEIEILDENGATIKSIDIPKEGIVSITFLKEDKHGNFYIQTESTKNGKIMLEVHKFNSDGEYLTKITLQDTDYSCWTIKLLSIDENGNIYQFLPAKETAKLNIFYKE